MLPDEENYLHCDKCGTSHINELRDGRDFVEVAITKTPLEGYEPIYYPPQQKRTLCAYCMSDLTQALIAAGFPAWWAHGWANESDAIHDGWDPQNPHVNPFNDDEE